MDKDSLKGGNMWRKAIILVVSVCFVWSLSLYADKDVSDEVGRGKLRNGYECTY